MRKFISLLALVIIGSSLMAPVGFALIDETLQEVADREFQERNAEDIELQYASQRDVEGNEEVNIEVLKNSPEVKAAVEALPDARTNAKYAQEDIKNAEKYQKAIGDNLDAADAELKVAIAGGDDDKIEAAQEKFDKAMEELAVADAAVDKAIADSKVAADRVKDLEATRDRALDQYYQNKKSILPQTNKDITDCKALMNEVAMNSKEAKKKFETRKDEYIQDVLGCGIKTGDMRLWMIPYYVRFVLEFILQISGLVAIGGIIYGSYLYMFAGVSDEKDRGKKAIMYGVAGIIVAMVAWGVVNILISFLTG